MLMLGSASSTAFAAALSCCTTSGSLEAWGEGSGCAGRGSSAGGVGAGGGWGITGAGAGGGGGLWGAALTGGAARFVSCPCRAQLPPNAGKRGFGTCLQL